MPSDSPALSKGYWPLLFSLFILIAFQLLFLFRSFDDNRLTSWQWVFHGVNVTHVILLLVVGLIAAYVMSRVSLFERSPVVFLFTFSFLASAFFWGEPEVIVDSSRYFTQAKHLEIYGIRYFFREWGNEINAWTDLPLLPFLYGVLFKAAGESRIYIQIFNSFLFSMTVVCTCLLGKALWSEGLGFIAGLLLAGIPYLLTQPPLMLVDIGTMFFLTFSLFAFTMALTRGSVWTPVASAAVVCAVFSKFSTWMMLSVLGVIFLVLLIEKNPVPAYRRRLLVRGLSVALMTLIPAGALILYKYDLIAGQIQLLLTYQKPALKVWGESFASTYLFQIHPFITIAAVSSLFSAIRKRDLRYLIISWLTILMIILWIKRIRYIVPLFPMVALMASYGFLTIRDRTLRRYCAFAIVSASLVVGVFTFLPFLKNMGPANLERAGRYLNSLEAPISGGYDPTIADLFDQSCGIRTSP